MSISQRVVARVLVVVLLLLAVIYAIGRGLFGTPVDAGEITGPRVPPDVVAARRAASAQILFGDLHVHSGFSIDAFLGSLPLAGGEGAYSVADACDFARYCSALDFWSINDHANGATPRSWRQTVDSIRQCNALAGDAADPDVVAFLGWEWTQIGSTPENHYGHKNVVLKYEDDARIPARPIAADSPFTPFSEIPTLALGVLPIVGRDSAYLDAAATFDEIFSTPRCPDGVPVRQLPDDCREYAATPAELFAKLDEWGHEAVVIPHGTTWGNYTPAGSSFAKQLDAGNHDPRWQRLVEVYSGHGGAEEYRPWRGALHGDDGGATCPPATEGYVPTCWQAGEIARGRCTVRGEPAETCDTLAEQARQYFVDAPGTTGHLTLGGEAPEAWGTAGQCTDCFLPAFNFRPLSSVQAMLAYRADEAGGDAAAFRFGLIGSSDTHTSRAGSGYKEVERIEMTDARLSRISLRGAERLPREPEPRPVDPYEFAGPDWAERERLASYFFTGGLAAVHAASRDREGIFSALQRREVYATSGPRILVWFDLLNAGAEPLPMGSEAQMHQGPRFRVRAVGSQKQLPGCPDDAASGLGPERLERLCRGECFHPADERRRITRIEVVRIRPQASSDEPIGPLIEDPWRSLACGPSVDGCTVEFEDEAFTAAERDSVYYVRAVEEASQAIGVASTSCAMSSTEDCLEPTEERAWSSPIFVDYQAERRTHVSQHDPRGA